MIDPDVLERAECEVDILVNVLHKELNYWQILRLFLDESLTLQMQADVEYWAKLKD